MNLDTKTGGANKTRVGVARSLRAFVDAQEPAMTRSLRQSDLGPCIVCALSCSMVTVIVALVRKVRKRVSDVDSPCSTAVRILVLFVKATHT